MHFIIFNNSFVNTQLTGFVCFDFLGTWGVKVVNMD